MATIWPPTRRPGYLPGVRPAKPAHGHMSNPNPDLFAWIGEDELGSGEVGLKQALMACGMTPLVTIHRETLERILLLAMLQQQADIGRKTIRFCRYVLVEEIIVLTPK